jgi:hypothetical protein
MGKAWRDDAAVTFGGWRRHTYEEREISYISSMSLVVYTMALFSSDFFDFSYRNTFVFI